MSQAPDAGAPASAEGQGAGVPAQRAYVIGRLEAELRQAESCFEYGRAAELKQQIRQLSAGTAGNPSKETRTRPVSRSRAATR